ncbi:Vsp/OspC family lipoprotein [Borrelia duttonii]|uniref:Vsp protein n=1 Tax=Borrelia duttonii (strain Ly) TaxID=412419 RepID=B5RPG3_BORDL|nr:vsp protein [Borrelia duttonii Ly]
MKRGKKGEMINRVMIMMMVMVMGCNNGGVKEGEEGKAKKGDGSVIDLKAVSKKIRDAVEFAGKVKEVRVLVKSVDELAKAIKKKIDQNGGLVDGDADKNGSLLAGAHSVISAVKVKVELLEKTSEISNNLKTKVTEVKNKVEAFLDKLKDNHSDLGKEGATDAHAKSAIDVTANTKDKGAKELVELNKEVDELLKASNKIVSDAIAELVVKPTT